MLLEMTIDGFWRTFITLWNWDYSLHLLATFKKDVSVRAAVNVELLKLFLLELWCTKVRVGNVKLLSLTSVELLSFLTLCWLYNVFAVTKFILALDWMSKLKVTWCHIWEFKRQLCLINAREIIRVNSLRFVAQFISFGGFLLDLKQFFNHFFTFTYFTYLSKCL